MKSSTRQLTKGLVCRFGALDATSVCFSIWCHIPNILNLGCLFFSISFFPQQLEKLGVLPIKLKSSGSPRLHVQVPLIKVPRFHIQVQVSEGSTLKVQVPNKGSGSPRFYIKVPLLDFWAQGL